jgi:DMSO/TMAO reductase YedYZ molybdopterin-dependent catalytic subunit
MVYITGLLLNLNHITTGMNVPSWWGWWIYVIFMALVVALWWAATPLTLRYPRAVQKTGRYIIGWAKGLVEYWDPRATYPEKAISPFFWPNGTLPSSQQYANLRKNDFRDYTLRIGGLVEHPMTLSYDRLKAMAKQEQITQHYCIQGWSGVAKWGGVPMRDILALVRPMPQARWAIFYSYASGPGGYDAESEEGGRYYDAHKLEHMQHQLTILAYEMNGEPLNELHGAPLRLRNELELGFKQVKWIEAIEFVESFGIWAGDRAASTRTTNFMATACRSDSRVPGSTHRQLELPRRDRLTPPAAHRRHRRHAARGDQATHHRAAPDHHAPGHAARPPLPTVCAAGPRLLLSPHR